MKRLACGCVLGWERCMDCRAGLHLDQEKALAVTLSARSISLSEDEAYALFLIVDTVARVERGIIPATNYLRERLLPVYREWHTANPGKVHPALAVTNGELQ